MGLGVGVSVGLGLWDRMLAGDRMFYRGRHFYTILINVK